MERGSGTYELIPYSREPLDVKLTLLLLIRKWWVFLLTSVFGVLLVGGGYYLRYVVFAGPAMYESTANVYVEYVKDENGKQATIFNQTTWGQILQDNVFTDAVCEALKKDAESGKPYYRDYVEGTELTKEDINSWVKGTLLSDERIVTVTVKTPAPELTEQITGHLMKGFESLKEAQPEIGDVRLMGVSTTAKESFRDVRLLRACILGLILFDLAAALVIWLRMVADDSIYVPITFERRYGIPMLGSIASPNFDALVKELLGDGITILFPGAEAADPETLQKRINASGMSVADIITLGKDKNSDLGERLRNAEHLLLAVPAGAHNGKLLEETLSLCDKCGAKIKAAVLHPADEDLLRAYLNLPVHEEDHKTK